MAIDESRNSSDYAIRAAVARLYRQASTPELVPVFQALVDQKTIFEEHLDPDYMLSMWDKPKEEQTRAWQQAWQAVAADAVMCGPSVAIAEFIQRKGHVVQTVPSANIVQAAHRFGVKTEHQVLSENEKKGREKTPATEAAVAAVDEVWGWLTTYNLTNDR